MKNVVCIIARTNSSRLKKKVLKEVGRYTLIEYLILKLKKAKLVDEIYLCTSVDVDDEILLSIAEKNGIKAYAGSRESVIDRMIEVGDIEKATNVIRVTGDNIFTDEVYLDLLLNKHMYDQIDYSRVEYLPIGVTPEVINLKALKSCYSGMNPNNSQYLMLYMFMPNKYRCQVILPPEIHRRPEYTLTVDTIEDYKRTVQIIEERTDLLLNYNDVLTIIKSKDISYLEFKSEGVVKLPSDVVFSYAALRTELNHRIKRSNKIQLTIEEYNDAAERQNF